MQGVTNQASISVIIWAYCLIVQYYSNKMEEYLSNIGFLNVLDHMHYRPPQDSSLLLLSNSQDSPPFPFYAIEITDPPDKRELPTANGNTEERVAGYNSERNKSISIITGIDFRWEVKEQCGYVRQGTKDDTVELNINFKTILSAHLRRLIQANQLTPQQTKAALAFMQRSPSFNSLVALCDSKNDNVSGLCLEFAESSVLVSRILGSRCAMNTKLQMIKFLEVFRANLRGGKIRRWKQATMS